MSYKQDRSPIVKAEPGNSAETNGQPSEIKIETKALVNAIRTRTQIELQNASDLTREAYLSTVRQVKDNLETNQLIDPEEIEKLFQTLQQETEKNWQSISDEISDFGNRLTEAAQAAWDILTEPNKRDERNNKNR